MQPIPLCYDYSSINLTTNTIFPHMKILHCIVHIQKIEPHLLPLFSLCPLTSVSLILLSLLCLLLLSPLHSTCLLSSPVSLLFFLLDLFVAVHVQCRSSFHQNRCDSLTNLSSLLRSTLYRFGSALCLCLSSALPLVSIVLINAHYSN